MAGASLSRRILARAAGREGLREGQVIEARVDLAMTYDPFAGALARRLRARWGEQASLFDPGRVVLVADHFLDLDDPRHRALQAGLAELAGAFGVERSYPLGAPNHGVCHALLPEEGLVRPGALIAGSDSHTCTYGGLGAIGLGVGLDAMEGILATGWCWLEVPPDVRIEIDGRLPPEVMAKDVALALAAELGGERGLLGAAVELDGEAVQRLPPDEKLTLANMAAEMGARWLVVPAAPGLLERLGRAAPGCPVAPGPAADYARRYRFRGEDFEPMVARPGAPDDALALAALPATAVDEVYVGSCTGAKGHDLEVFCAELAARGGPAAGVRLLIVPATRRGRDWLLADAARRALLAGAEIAAQPGCNACFGGHGFLAAAGVTRVSTSNRNYPGRMGSPEAAVYLASPRTAARVAASGVLGP